MIQLVELPTPNFFYSLFNLKPLDDLHFQVGFPLTFSCYTCEISISSR